MRIATFESDQLSLFGALNTVRKRGFSVNFLITVKGVCRVIISATSCVVQSHMPVQKRD